MGARPPLTPNRAAEPDHHSSSREQARGPSHPKHDAHQYGQFMRLVNDMTTGNADASKVVDFLGTMDVQFWKGALVGMGATLLLTNSAAKNAIAGALSGVLGLLGKEREEKTE
ncbi:MAG: hypothetical protein V1816_16545 [Pseudomonadota bacterium]